MFIHHPSICYTSRPTLRSLCQMFRSGFPALIRNILRLRLRIPDQLTPVAPLLRNSSPVSSRLLVRLPQSSARHPAFGDARCPFAPPLGSYQRHLTARHGIVTISTDSCRSGKIGISPLLKKALAAPCVAPEPSPPVPVVPRIFRIRARVPPRLNRQWGALFSHTKGEIPLTPLFSPYLQLFTFFNPLQPDRGHQFCNWQPLIFGFSNVLRFVFYLVKHFADCLT